VTSGLEKLLAARKPRHEWLNGGRYADKPFTIDRTGGGDSQRAAQICRKLSDGPGPQRIPHDPRACRTMADCPTTVYNRLRAADVKVLDFAQRGGRGRKVVPMGEILKIEGRQSRGFDISG